MNKLTPGNWKLGNCNSVVTDTRREREHTISDERAFNFYGGELICESIENPADAMLIKAAPKLLKAAQKAMRDCVDLIATDAGNALEDAIREATSEVKS